LALVVIGGAAVAIKRRRSDEEEWADEQYTDDGSSMSVATAEAAHEQAMEEQDPPVIAPPISAFRWNSGDGRAAPDSPEETYVEKDDREPGETWVQRAYRGPSALNPSVSLKARLKRAAFFDKRERDAAAGLAKPVDPSAGLPDCMIEEEQEQQNAEFA
jgi:hypothetical protein